MKEEKVLTTNRRAFLTGLGTFAVSSYATAGHDIAPKDDFKGTLSGRKIKFAAIGCGGMGGAATNSLISAGGELVAVCDINPKAFEQWEKKYPGIPKFTDYREMLEKLGDRFEAVEVGTPDHTHAYISIDCMNAGKHVYVQKPLARTVEECELMLEAQRRTGVVVQMGNQGHPGVWRYKALRDAGVWGEIKAIYSWSDRPIWPQGMTEYAKPEPLPQGYAPNAWDCWCGPSEDHGYSSAYHHFKWRGWWAYGCGAIGDMAVHNADPAVWALELGLPTTVVGDVCGAPPVTIAYPKKSTIRMTFAPNKWVPNGVGLTWYDGGLKPNAADVPGLAEWAKTRKNGVPSNGLVIVGTKATTISGSHASPPTLLVGDKAAFDAAIAEGSKRCNYNHYREFIEACLAEEPSRCGSKLSYAVPLTEALLIGCISLRFPGKTLAFDADDMEFTGDGADAANEFLKAPQRGDWDFDNLDRPWWQFWKLFC